MDDEDILGGLYDELYKKIEDHIEKVNDIVGALERYRLHDLGKMAVIEETLRQLITSIKKRSR